MVGVFLFSWILRLTLVMKETCGFDINALLFCETKIYLVKQLTGHEITSFSAKILLAFIVRDNCSCVCGAEGVGHCGGVWS